ncbi:aminomethyltransferase [Oesophagostomum dentatum]|uniref:Aminomethyltransferase n=1 Tax=Oesophagostomum dentatum TaxID=61180 RepID=A0A0B1ST02_OESDE|nr:aminomethyltransferase [Oesophagostomum dentatum]
MNRVLAHQRILLRWFSSASTKRTCLFDLHNKYNAKMVPFAGYEMPVQYPDLNIQESCRHTRDHVSIFDVSHMLQTLITGKDRVAFIESLTPADVQGLAENSGTLSVFTNEKGGIKDDLIVTKTDRDYIYMVTNAGCIDKDLPYLQENAAKWRSNGKDVNVIVLDGRGLIALQGPEMVKVLQPETDIDLSKLTFMTTAVGKVFGIEDCRVTRCGYTGEDGVEISVPGKDAATLAEKLLQSKNGTVRLAGLGARDALRMEAGLCLYGNDIDENTTPAEAGLAFVVAKRRRETLGFPGAEKVVEQLKSKTWPKQRVGLISDPGRAPRAHLPIIDPLDKCAIGFVTSGCPSPCLNKNIAIAYVDKPYSKVGTKFVVDFGTKQTKVTVTKMPFVPTKYYTKSS